MRAMRAVLSLALPTLGLALLAPAGYGAGPTSTPEGIVFTFEAPEAGQVHIAGEFNDWTPTRDAMDQVREGLWQITLALRPGTYTYPTDPVFTDGAFDLTSLEIMLDGQENVIFKLGVAGGLDSPRGGITGYSLQAIDIYIDTDGIADLGQRSLFRARKARTASNSEWEYFVRACMDTVAIYDETGTRLEQSGVKSYPDKASSSIFVTFPRASIPGGKNWNVIKAEARRRLRA